MASMDSWWQRLSPMAQRSWVVGVIGTVLIAIVIGLAMLTPEVAKPLSKQAIIRHILTDSDPRSLGIDGISAQLRDLLAKHDEQSRRLQAIEEQQKREQQSDEERFKQWTAAEREAYETKLQAVSGEVASLKNQPSGLSTKFGPSASAATAASLPLSLDGAATDATFPPLNSGGRRPSTLRSTNDVNDLNSVFDQAALAAPVPSANTGISGRAGQAGQTHSALQIREIKEDKPSPGQTVKSSSEQPRAAAKHSEVFIPAGSILTGVLLNGLDAPTGKKSKKEPMPVLFRIKKEAILPNRFHADVRECFLLASGFGDLSAERAYFRGETFSCVRQDGGVIEVPMNAYATGEDGKNGVRGRVVSKQGALLAQSMMAGFLRGFSDAFGRNQIPMLMTGGLGSLSGTTPFQSAFSSQSMEGGALKGAGYAMERLSHFYMDMAEEIYPVIEVDATRQVNFIVQKGTALKLKTPL